MVDCLEGEKKRRKTMFKSVFGITSAPKEGQISTGTASQGFSSAFVIPSSAVSHLPAAPLAASEPSPGGSAPMGGTFRAVLPQQPGSSGTSPAFLAGSSSPPRRASSTQFGQKTSAEAAGNVAAPFDSTPGARSKLTGRPSLKGVAAGGFDPLAPLPSSAPPSALGQFAKMMGPRPDAPPVNGALAQTRPPPRVRGPQAQLGGVAFAHHAQPALPLSCPGKDVSKQPPSQNVGGRIPPPTTKQGIVLLFHSHIRALLNPDPEQRERDMTHLEKAFFDPIGAQTFAPSIIFEMQRVISQEALNSLPDAVAPSQLKLWVPIFFLGSNVNSLVKLAESTKKAADLNTTTSENSTGGDAEATELCDKLDRLLTIACERANNMTETLREIASSALKDGPYNTPAPASMLMPFSVIPIILKRHRETFDMALQLRGLTGVDAKSQAPSLFAALKTAPLKAPPGTLVGEMAACAVAAVIAEYCASGKPLSKKNVEEFLAFADAFLRFCPHLALSNSTLRFRIAAAIISNSCNKDSLTFAFGYISQALDLCPPDQLSNRRLLFDSLCMCGLALGKVPDDDTVRQFGAEDELLDFIEAVRCASLPLFEAAVRNNLPFFIERGLAGVLHTIRSNILAGMVMKHYDEVRVRNRDAGARSLDVTEMLVKYQWTGLDVDEACATWILPLLLQPRIMGAIQDGKLLLNKTRPFYEVSDAAPLL